MSNLQEIFPISHSLNHPIDCQCWQLKSNADLNMVKKWILFPCYIVWPLLVSINKVKSEILSLQIIVSVFQFHGLKITFSASNPISLLYWMVGFYYYDFLINERICLILVIHTFNPHVPSVLCSLRCLPNHFYYMVHYFSLSIYRLLLIIQWTYYYTFTTHTALLYSCLMP